MRKNKSVVMSRVQYDSLSKSDEWAPRLVAVGAIGGKLDTRPHSSHIVSDKKMKEK